jgi:hypothetical protein
MARKTTITIETHSFLVLQSRNSRRAWCPQCAAEGEMIALWDADAISEFNRAAVEQWLSSGELHRVSTPDGLSLICMNSLLDCLQNPKPTDRGLRRLPKTKEERT